MRPLKVLHTADVHLGLSHAGLAGLEERSFVCAIDFAIEQDVDVVLIVGDLFDHGRVSEDLLGWTAKELDRLERPIVLLSGNHDPLDSTSVHHRFRVTERCAQVSFLDAPGGSVVDLPELELAVWGRALVEHSPSFQPLAGIPSQPDGRWGIVAGHGQVLPSDRPSHHGSPITPAEIADVAWDYVALGHHHAFKVLREPPRPAVYPGALARSCKGQPGLVIADFVPSDGVAIEWHALSP